MTISFATSTAVHVPIRFSKQQLFEELAWFMPALASSFERLYGSGMFMHPRSQGTCFGALDVEMMQTTPLWRSLSELYNYGFYGVLPALNELGDGLLADVESFLGGIDGLAQYLQEDDGGIPKLSKRTIELARSRQLLDEGATGDRLAVSQVALLANADESWLLQFSGLNSDGGIRVEEVRQWLAECPSFTATGNGSAPEFTFARTLSIGLPVDVLRAIQERAGRTGKTPFEVLRIVFKNEIAEAPLFASNARDSSHANSAGTA